MDKQVSQSALNDWEHERDKLKVLWVSSVLAFWFSFIFQMVLFFFNGQINFILVSIIGGMMVLGVALKLKLQSHHRKKPGTD